MVSSGFVPWYNRPAREYPIKRWLAQRYGFTVSSSVFAREAQRPTEPLARRRFPAQVWLEEQAFLARPHP
jgi:hypothetical protein